MLPNGNGSMHPEDIIIINICIYTQHQSTHIYEANMDRMEGRNNDTVIGYSNNPLSFVNRTS